MSALKGKRILVTRPRPQAEELCDQLAAYGAIPIRFPTIEIAPIEDLSPLREALQNLSRYHWIVFTSVNGVAAFWEQPTCANINLPPHLKIAAIGPTTARALTQRGVHPDLIPDEYIAEALVAGIGDIHDQRILLPRAQVTRDVLGKKLRYGGAVVHEIAVYRTVTPSPLSANPMEALHDLEAITFTSSSTVRGFIQFTQNIPHDSWGKADIACIGPITAQTANEMGLSVNVIAAEYTVNGLVAALNRHYQ